MHHHARGLVSAFVGLPASMSFSGLLQAAAERAWSRCHSMSTRAKCESRKHPNAVHPGISDDSALTVSDKLVSDVYERSNSRGHTIMHMSQHEKAPLMPSANVSPTRSLQTGSVPHVADTGARSTTPRASRTRSSANFGDRQKLLFIISFLNADSLSLADISNSDPARAPQEHIDDVVDAHDNVLVSTELTGLHSLAIREPNTPEGLYQNLLYMLSYLPSSPTHLRTLAGYYFRPFKILNEAPSLSGSPIPYIRSVRSYNFLIALALHHSAYRMVARLFQRMRMDELQGNQETWKLWTRWRIRTGQWESAWSEVRTMAEQRSHDALLNGSTQAQGLPLPIWLEFLGSMRSGVSHAARGEFTGNRSHLSSLDIVPRRGDGLNKMAAAELERYETLCQYRPSLTSNESVAIPPRVVYFIVRMMLRTGQRQSARDLTDAYLGAPRPPKTIPAKWSRDRLAIVHLHVIYHGHPRRDLPTHFRIRKEALGILGSHHNLKPSSTTLYLLLGTLKDVKNCASVGLRLLRLFTRRWGPTMEDSRVRRRLASLSVKQRNWRVMKMMLERQSREDSTRKMWKTQHDILGGSELDSRRYRRLYRRPWHKVYKKRSAEEWKWILLRRRIKRIVRQLKR